MTVLQWDVINKDKIIQLDNVTGMFISNTGDVPFTFCGQTILPGKRLQMPIYGNPTTIYQSIAFLKSKGGNKSATLEYTFLKGNVCKG